MVSASTYPSFYSLYILHTSLTLSVRNVQGLAVLRVANTRRTVWIDLMYTEKRRRNTPAIYRRLICLTISLGYSGLV
jgi:hypothetical protein